MTKIVGISGSLGSPSRTRVLVENIINHLNASLHAKSEIIDLAETGHLFWQASYPATLSAEAKAIFDRVEAADILVVGSPVYKGSYSGLFKHFFDLLDPNVLNGKLVILSATGGSDYHALVLEHQLRPLFGFFGAVTAPIGVYAKEADFIDGKQLNLSVTDRIGNMVYHALRLIDPEKTQNAAA